MDARADPWGGGRTPVSLIVVDTYELFARGLTASVAQVADISVVAVTTHSGRGIDLIIEHRPAVAVVSREFPDGDGLELTRQVRAQALPTRILLCVDHPVSELVLQALTAGVAGVVSRDVTANAIVDGIRSVAAGELVLPAVVGSELVATLRSHGAPPNRVLSDRETEVLQRIADGESAAVIAAALALALPTVKTHIQSIYVKLGAHDRGSAVARAIRRGIIS